MKKRLSLLALALCLGLLLCTGVSAAPRQVEPLPCVPAGAAPAAVVGTAAPLSTITEDNCYAIPYAQCYGQSVVEGETMQIKIYAYCTGVPSREAAVCLQIYTGTAPTDDGLIFSDARYFTGSGGGYVIFEWNTSGVRTGDYTAALFTYDVVNDAIIAIEYFDLYVAAGTIQYTGLEFRNEQDQVTTSVTMSLCNPAEQGFYLQRTPYHATNSGTDCTITNSNSSVAVVEDFLGYYFVKPVGPGTTVITGTMNGKTATLTVTVQDHSYSDSVVEVVTPSTATQPGVGKIVCSRCGAEGTTEIPPVFRDLTGYGTYYYPALDYCYEHGIINGMEEHLFGPGENVTRGMAITILYRLDGSQSVSTDHPFVDVAPTKYYAAAISWGYEHGIVNGMDATHFDPEAPITREQAVAMLYRYAEYTGKDISAQADLSVFQDAGSIHQYARTPMAWALANNIITGVTPTQAAPLDTAIRAQFVTILFRYINNL